MTEQLKKTPLYDFHARQGARFVPFGGWEMPVQYSTILQEHLCVRQKVGLFDVSHMGEFLVHGPDAEAFLNYLLPADISSLVDGKVLYSAMCYEDGGVVDDLLVYKVAEQNYFICVNASNIEKDFEWMESKRADFGCELLNVSDEFAQLALQGPKAAEVMEVILGKVATDLKGFTFERVEWRGHLCIISRTGYTGEDGFEVYCPPAAAEELAQTMLDRGESAGIQMIGLGARDSLRLEAGLPLYGHELSEKITPLHAGFGWTVKLKKESDFIGKAALSELKKNGLDQKVVHYVIDDKRIAREGASVVSNGQVVGTVLSGTQSPILEKPIGSALINSDAVAGDCAVDIRGKAYPISIKKAPLHK